MTPALPVAPPCALPRIGRWVGPPLLALAGLWAATPWASGRLLVNESSSVPRGLYVRVRAADPVPGDLVAARQPPTATLYLSGLGVPPGMPLVKRIAGVGGDRACRDGDSLRVRERAHPVLEHDRRATALPAWTACRRLHPDEVFLLGDTATSFDSRYFGPVRRRDILGVYRQALSW